MTQVPKSVEFKDNEELIIDRQIVELRTLSETTFATICELTPDTGGELFKQWDDTHEPPDHSTLQIAGTLANPIAVGEEFYVEYEVDITKYEFYIENINEVCFLGDIRCSVYEFDGVGQHTPLNEIAASVMNLPRANVVVGWNTVELTTPLNLRYGRFLFRLGPDDDFGGLSSYDVRTLRWIGDYDYDAWTYTGGLWGKQSDQDIMCRLWFDSETISEGFVFESGKLLNFDFRRSTLTDNEDMIFQDECYTDTDLYDIIMGVAADYQYTQGRLETTANGPLILMAKPNNDYGIETRSLLFKTIVSYDGVPENAPIAFFFHETHPDDIGLDGNDHPEDGRGYAVIFDLVTGELIIRMMSRFEGNSGWWDHLGAPALPSEAVAAGVKLPIWIKIVDDTISVFTDMNGFTVEENYIMGNSVAKSSIWRFGTGYFDFARYGLFGLYVGEDLDVRFEYLRLYGKFKTSDLTGGQGIFMDWGDDTDSGFIVDTEVEKIYAIEPSDTLEEYPAKVHGKNKNDAPDLGFVPAWIDYPEDIPQDEYERQTFDFDVLNAEPVAVLNVVSVGYVGVTVQLDAIGSEDPEGGDLIYHWNFGNGATTITTSPFVSHIYNSLGTYTAELYVTDEYGNISSTVTSVIVIGELFSDFKLLEFNHAIQGEQINRSTGASSDNIPDRCGGEIQDSGPGNRVFNITGLHAPPRCCCEDEHDYLLSLDLETPCTRILIFGEGIGEEESGGGVLTACDTNIHEVLGPLNSSLFVGDIVGNNSMQSVAGSFALTSPQDVCRVDLYLHDDQPVLSGFPWSVKVSIQGDAGGVPDGVELISTMVLASALFWPGWNIWEFGASVALAPLTTYWIVVEPDPCPIGSFAVDRIQVGFVVPFTYISAAMHPLCPGIGAWGPVEETMLRKIWATSETNAPDIIETFDTITTSYIDVGCCDLEEISYDGGGAAQSISVSDLTNIDSATKLKVVFSICKSFEYDGDVQITLLENLFTSKRFSTSTPVIIENEDILYCTGDVFRLLYNTTTEGGYLEENPANTIFTPEHVTLVADVPTADFGTGADGDVNLVFDAQLVADMNYENLTVGPCVILDTAGFIVRVRGRLINNGTITDLQNGGAVGVGGAGAAAPGAEGDGNNGANGGAGGAPVVAQAGQGGWGGGGGGSGATQDNADPVLLGLGGDGGDGGDGGLGGGYVVIFAWELDNQGSINANGEDADVGLDGTDGTRAVNAANDLAGGGGGGGGGGQGGLPGNVELSYGSIIVLGTVTANGGTGGAGGIAGDGQNLLFNSPDAGNNTGGVGGVVGGGDGGDGEEDDTESDDGINGLTGESPERHNPTLTLVPGEIAPGGSYVMTVGNQINTITWGAITSIDIDLAEIAGGSVIRFLVSFDGRVTWMRWTGAAWAVAPLANITAIGNTALELGALNETQWALEFIAGTLDIAADLRSLDTATNPQLAGIDINFEYPGSGMTRVAAEFNVCPRILEDFDTLYFSITPSHASKGTFSLITTTPFSDIYHGGSKYLLENGAWDQSAYEDFCMKIYAKEDCADMGWCEYEYVDYLRCIRALVKIDLPGVGVIGGKIFTHSVSKTYSEPYEWVPFNIVFEEIDLEQLTG
ncbi:MAG: PKD domain-containing protein [Deltaproteobacteria bacterium]|nr:PKD domain-containing protein [Deltaproteobacteria bacterium]